MTGQATFSTGRFTNTDFANQPHSTSRDDGLQLLDAFISAPVHCAPPDFNKPTIEEILTCRSYLAQELQLLRNVRVVVALGGIAWNVYLAFFRNGN